jgi:hypothetical protein
LPAAKTWGWGRPYLAHFLFIVVVVFFTRVILALLVFLVVAVLICPPAIPALSMFAAAVLVAAAFSAWLPDTQVVRAIEAVVVILVAVVADGIYIHQAGHPCLALLCPSTAATNFLLLWIDWCSRPLTLYDRPG